MNDSDFLDILTKLKLFCCCKPSCRVCEFKSAKYETGDKKSICQIKNIASHLSEKLPQSWDLSELTELVHDGDERKEFVYEYEIRD